MNGKIIKMKYQWKLFPEIILYLIFVFTVVLLIVLPLREFTHPYTCPVGQHMFILGDYQKYRAICVYEGAYVPATRK